MHGDEPGGDEVDKVMQHVRVADAVHGGEEGEGKKEERGRVPRSGGCDAGDHLAPRQRLDQEHERHYA